MPWIRGSKEWMGEEGAKCKNEMQREMEERERNAVEKGVLYVVATPIGNLNDLTPRMREALEAFATERN